MSAYRSNKRPPHIVFLVDTLPFLPPNTLDESSVSNLQAMIVRILLYYVDMVDDRITWGFRFFNTNSASITMSNRRFLPVSSSSIDDFVKELHAKVDLERNKLATTTPSSLMDQQQQQRSIHKKTIHHNKASTDSCFSNLKQTLMQTLAEFQWKDIDLLGASPRSQRIRNSAKSGPHHQHDQPLPVHNYMYVISHRPHTVADLQYYMDRRHDRNSVQTRLTLELDKVDALTCIQKMADELKRWLWDDYANHQISINWIDRENTKVHQQQQQQQQPQQHRDMDLLIQTGFGSIMHMFGGHLITEHMLKCDFDYWGLSFGTVFNHYRSLHMSSVPQLKLPMIPDLQGKKLISTDEATKNSDTPLWCGPFISKTGSPFNLQVNVGPLQSTQTDPAHTTLFDEITSIEIVNFLSADESKQDWLQHTGDDIYTLWSSDNEFLAVIRLLHERQMVLIVRLCLDAPGGHDAKLAVVEPVFDGCASISPLPAGQTLHPCETADANPALEPLLHPPLGSNITDSVRHSVELSPTLNAALMASDLGLSMAPPPCVNALLDRYSRSSIKGTVHTLNTIPKRRKPEEPNAIVTAKSMPSTIDQFTQAIQDLYLDTLYTTKYTLLESMTTLLCYIDHVSNLAKQNKFELPLIMAALQSLTMLSSEFDDKHRIKIPAMIKTGINKGGEQEVLCFSNWLSSVHAKYGRNTDHEELSFKALKIKDAKMQIIFLLATIQTTRQCKDSKAEVNKKKRRDKHAIGQTDLASENPEEQLEIYFDRMFIWEQVSNVVGFLQERDAEAAEQSTKRLDPADIHIHHFCSHLEKCFIKTLPRLIGKLRDKVDKDDSSGDKDDFDDAFPTPNKRRKTLLEMRIRGDSPGETMTANWTNDSQESSTKTRYQPPPPPVEPVSSGASKRKQSMFPILPFMKREIIMSKAVNSKAKQPEPTGTKHTSNDSKPSFRRTGSFTKSATSPKRRSVKRKPTTETNTVVMRKRVPDSPTTPRTRMARDFGISMTPTLSVPDNDDLMTASLLTRSPHRPKSTRSLGIAVSPARSTARKIIGGHKSPRTHRTGSTRELIHHDQEDGPRDLTNALLAARAPPSKTDFRAKSEVRKTFSSLFDD